MAYPDKSDMAFLAGQGIKTLVNLTEYDCYSRAAEKHGLEMKSIFIPEFEPPTQEQIQEFIEVVDSTKEGEAVGVHCMMGRGRTGTMLACYLVAKEGYGAKEAIKETRRQRVYSVETRGQEKAVRDFQKSLQPVPVVG